MGHILELPDELLRKIAQYLISEARQEFENDKALICRQPALVCKKFSTTYIAVLWKHPYLCERTIPKFTAALKGVASRSPEFVKNVKHLTISWKERHVPETKKDGKVNGKGKGKDGNYVDGTEDKGPSDRKGKGRQIDVDMNGGSTEDDATSSSPPVISTTGLGGLGHDRMDATSLAARGWDYYKTIGQGYLRDNEQGPLTQADTERREGWNRYQPFYLMCQQLADVFDRAQAASIAGTPDIDNGNDDDLDRGDQPEPSRGISSYPTKRTHSDAELYFRHINADLDGPFSSPDAAVKMANRRKGTEYTLKWDDQDEINKQEARAMQESRNQALGGMGTHRQEGDEDEDEDMTVAYNAVYFGGESEGVEGEGGASGHNFLQGGAGPSVVRERMTPFTLDVEPTTPFTIEEDRLSEEGVDLDHWFEEDVAEGGNRREETEEFEDAGIEKGEGEGEGDGSEGETEDVEVEQEDEREDSQTVKQDDYALFESHEEENQEAQIDPLDIQRLRRGLNPPAVAPRRSTRAILSTSRQSNRSVSSEVESRIASRSALISGAIGNDSSASGRLAALTDPNVRAPTATALAWTGRTLGRSASSSATAEAGPSTRINGTPAAARQTEMSLRTGRGSHSGTESPVVTTTLGGRAIPTTRMSRPTAAMPGATKERGGKVILFVPKHHVIPLRRVPLIALTLDGLDFVTHTAVRDVTFGLCHLRPRKVRFGYSVGGNASDQCQIGERIKLQHALRVNVARFVKVWSEDERLAAIYFQPTNTLSARVFVDAKLWILRQLSCRHIRLAVPKNMKSLEFLAGRRIAWRHYHRHGRAQLFGGELVDHPALFNQLMLPVPPAEVEDGHEVQIITDDGVEGEVAGEGQEEAAQVGIDTNDTIDPADNSAAPESTENANSDIGTSGWRQIPGTERVDSALAQGMAGATPQAFPLSTGPTSAVSDVNAPATDLGPSDPPANQTAAAGGTAASANPMMILQPIIPQWHPPTAVWQPPLPQGWDQNQFELAVVGMVAPATARSRSRSPSIGSYLSFSTKDDENINTQYEDDYGRFRGRRRQEELPEVERVALQTASHQRDLILNDATTLFELEVFPRDFDDERWFEYGLDLPMELCRIRYGTSSWEAVPVDAEAPDTFSIDEESAHSFARSPYVAPSPGLDFSGGEGGDDFEMLTDSGGSEEEDDDEEMVDAHED